MCLIYKGQVASIKADKFPDSKDVFNVLYFQNFLEDGTLTVDSVKDMQCRPVSVGDNVEIEVYVKPYLTKKGAIQHNLISVKGGIYSNRKSEAGKKEVKV